MYNLKNTCCQAAINSFLLTMFDTISNKKGTTQNSLTGKSMRVIHKLLWNCWCATIPLLGKTFPVLATKLQYQVKLKRPINLNNPILMTEKMQWLKLYLYSDNPIITQCVDKYKVREFITKRGCPEILNELIAAYDKVDDINWDKLPNKFVIKCNHGCGYNIICTDKKIFDIDNANKLLGEWMKTEYGLNSVELIYHNIPRKIICEKYIETENGVSPNDYKIFCSYGVPKLIYVISGGHNNQEYLDYYTPDWKWIPVQNGNLPNAGDIHKKPGNLNELLSYASTLSKGFPIVRVDLYDEFKKVIFGEMTFLATGGMPNYKPNTYDLLFGRMFPLYETKSSKAIWIRKFQY